MPERGNLLLSNLWTFLEIAILSLRAGQASPFRAPRNDHEPRETNRHITLPYFGHEGRSLQIYGQPAGASLRARPFVPHY
jgi:hypothetical protein